MIPKAMRDPKFIHPYLSGRKAQIRRQMTSHVDYMNRGEWKVATLKEKIKKAN
jgi:hypothetical protein